MTPEEIKLFGQPLFDKGARSTTTATYRRCTTCQQWKEYSEYHKDKNRDPQIIHICKVCESERRNKKRQAKYAKIEEKYGSVLPTSHGTLTETHKKCPRCLEWRSYDQFQRNKANLMNLANLCASCQYAYDIQRRYGITWKEYTTLLTIQGGGCAICGATKGNEKSPRLFVDHDHKTGKVRGLLCHQCNTMLGYAKDDVANLRRGIQYLERASK